MDLITILSDVRGQAIDLAGGAWPELSHLAEVVLPDPLDPLALLPVATGVACGAKVTQLITVSSGIVLLALGLRILDDQADEDNPKALHLSIGSGRAMNAATALCMTGVQTLSKLPLPPASRDSLLHEYFSAFLRVCQGQDEDVRQVAQNLTEYRSVVQAKTVTTFEFAAVAGAYVTITNSDTMLRIKQCGTSLGWMQQILDDIESLWYPDTVSDLYMGRLTFPVFYGLSMEHPKTPELRQLCFHAQQNEAQICALLDDMDVRSRLMTMALDYRDKALAALDHTFHTDGRVILQTWLDWLFRDGERLLGLDRF